MANTVSDIFSKYVPQQQSQQPKVTVAAPAVQQPLKVVKSTSQPSLSVAPSYPTNFVGPLPMTRPAEANDLFRVATPQQTKTIEQIQSAAPAKAFIPEAASPKNVAKASAVSDILSKYVPKVVGDGGQQAPPPVPEQKKEDGLLKSIVKAPIKSLLIKPAARTTEALGRLGVFGEDVKQGFELMEQEGQSIDIPLLGNFEISAVKTGTAGIKQIAGESLEAAANLMPTAGSLSVAKNIAQNAIKRAVLVGIADGTITGAMFGAGTGLQDNKGLKDIAVDTVTSALLGGLVGGGLSAGAAGLVSAIRSSKQMLKEFVDALVKQGVDPKEAQRLATQGGWIGKFDPAKDSVFRAGEPYDPQKMTDFGISVAKNKTTTDIFGGKSRGVQELRLDKHAKILTEIPDSIKVDENFDESVVRYARQHGFDAIDMAQYGVDEIRVINSNSLRPVSSKPKITSIDTTKPRGFGETVKTSPTEKALAPKRQMADTSIDSIQTEALKYKSADDFVKKFQVEESFDLTPGVTRLADTSETGLYHGAGITSLKSILSDGKIKTNVSRLDNVGEKVISLTGNRSVANSYGVVFDLKPDIPKTVAPKGAIKGDVYDAFEYRTKADIPLSKVESVTIPLNKGEGLDTKVMWSYSGKNPEYISARELQKQFESKGIKVLFNDGSNLTKTQLTDIWNKVHGANPTTPKVTSLDTTKPRGFGETVKTSPNTAKEVADAIDLTYTPITNEATMREAQEIVTRNVDEAIRVAKQTRPTAKSVATAQALINKFQQEGNFEQAVDMVEVMAAKLTQSGQAVQAASMYSRLSPEGILRVAQRAIDEANDKLPKKKQIKLTPDAAKDLVDAATNLKKLKDGRAKDVATADLLQKIADQVPANLAKKVSTIQTMAQLLNPKTIARNILGNFGFAGLENISDVLSVPLDKATSLVTGKRTKTFTGGQLSGFKKGLREGFEDAWLGIDTSATASQFDLPHGKVFKGKIFGGLEKLLNTTLRAPDRAFYSAAYEKSMRNQLKIAGVSTPTTEMMHQAHLDGLYKTFNDESIPARLLVLLKKGLNLNKEFGLGDILIKYPKTPGNLLARGIDYSPAGFFKTVIELAKPAFGRGFDQKKFVEAVSRASVGTTGLVGTGALLHRLGILTGAQGKDKDVNALERATGLGQYKLNLSALKRFVLSGFDAGMAKTMEGDNLASYDWFQPAAIGIALGANIDDSYGSDKSTAGKTVSGLTAMLSAFGSGLNTLGEQPVIQGLTKPLKYSDTPAEAALETLKGVPASFIPTVLNQIRQVVDPTQRSTADPDTEKETLNLILNKIPGLSERLPEKYTGFGDELKYDQGPIGSFISPAIMSKYATSPEQKMVLEIYKNSGQKQQAPRIISQSQTVNGKTLYLTSDQQSEMQRVIGDFTKQRFERLAQGEVKAFEKLSDEDKAKELAGIMTDINTAAKYIMLGHRPKRLSDRSKKYIRELKKQGVAKFDGLEEERE